MTKDLRNKLLSQVFLAVSQAAMPFVTYPVITKALGPEGLGKVAYIDSWVQLFGLFAGLGIPLYGIREIARQQDQPLAQANLFKALFLLQCMALLPATVVFFYIGKAFHFQSSLLLLGIAALAGNVLSSEWYFQGKEAFRFIAVRTIVIRLLTLLMIVLLVKKQQDVGLYYTILVSGILLSTFLNLWLCFRQVRFGFTDIQVRRHIKKLNWVYGCYLLFSFYSLTDTVILGSLASEAAVGAFNLGYRFLRLSSLFVISLGTVFYPKIAYLIKSGQNKSINSNIALSQQVISFFTLPFGFFFLCMAPEIVQVFATQQFSSSIAVMRIGSFIPFLLSLSHFGGIQVMLPLHREKVLFFCLAASYGLNLLLNFTLVPFYQEIGSAVATTATELSIAGCCVFFLVKNKMTFLLKPFIQNLLASAVVFPLGYFFRLQTTSPVQVLAFTFCGSVIFFLAVHWFVIRQSILHKLLQPSKWVAEEA